MSQLKNYDPLFEHGHPLLRSEYSQLWHEVRGHRQILQLRQVP
ncbi:hypothetical protein [Paraburkholderia youngii]